MWRLHDNGMLARLRGTIFVLEEIVSQLQQQRQSTCRNEESRMAKNGMTGAGVWDVEVPATSIRILTAVVITEQH